MTVEKIFQVLGALVSLATVTVVLTSPQTASVIRAAGSAFTSSITAAMGRR
jgi:hypothetical protein